MYLYRVHKFDFTVWMAAFVCTLFLGVEYGLGTAVIISLLIVIYESAYPHTAVLGRLPGTTLYRDIKQYEDAEHYDGLVIVGIDAPIYFANALNVRDKIIRYKRKAVETLAESSSSVKSVHYIVVDLSPVSHIDTTGLHMIEDMYQAQQGFNTQLCFCNPGIKVTRCLLQSDSLDRQHIYTSVIDAVQWCLRDMDSKQGEEA